MKRIIAFLFISIIIVGCSAPTEKRRVVKPEKKEIEQEEKEENVISQENAVAFLKEYGKNNPESVIEITTRLGSMKIKLYKDTPLHRANFIYLVKNKYFNDTYFHRVVKGFMIQGGNSDNWSTSKNRTKIGDYKIPNEIKYKHFHKRGALSASRPYDDNPTKMTFPFEFFIVQGHTFDKQHMDLLEEQYEKKISAAQREEYYKNGGTPHLDGEHTVFGEVIEGFDVIEKISLEETDKGEWPIRNVVMKIRIIK